MPHHRFARLITILALGCFVMTTLFSGVFSFPQKAQAQWTTTETGLGYFGAKDLKLNFGQTLMTSGLQAVMNAITQFTQQFAYDLAVGLASGAKGQNPLAFLQAPGAYFESLTQDAAGEFIGSLNQDWKELGLDLCQPRLPNIGLSIQLGVVDIFTLGKPTQRPKPKCEWSSIVNNWEAISREVQDPNQVLKHLSLSFQPGQSDLSQAVGAFAAAQEKAAKATEAGKAEREEGQGAKAVKSPISNTVQTPAMYTQEMFRSWARGGGLEAAAEANKMTQEQFLAASVIGGDAWAALGRTILNTFTNTLASRLLKVGLEGLFALGAPEKEINLKDFIGQNPTSNSDSAQAILTSLLTPNIKTSSYDILSELASCPEKRETAGLYQCAIDEKFAQGVREADRGKPLSVKEAVEKGYLDRDKPFGFVSPDAVPPAPAIEPDIQQGYPYSAMKKLRLARIIPVGWELAALRIKEVSQGESYTLGQVLDGFSKNGSNGICGDHDTPNESPFCGLVDPNWILKSPPAYCGARVFGSLVGSSGGRQEVCVDLKNCISEDDKGNCQVWGYCVREKNVWRIDGDICPAQYASCETYRSADGKINVSLLENTLDFGTCNADNAGCRWYSIDRNQTDAAQWDESRRIYLDGDAEKCAITSDGCTEFIPTAGVKENLIINPSFENDRDRNNVPDGWTGTTVQYATDGSQSLLGLAAVKINSSNSLSQAVRISPNNFYTVSAYIKAETVPAQENLIKISDCGQIELNSIIVSDGARKIKDDILDTYYIYFAPTAANQYQRFSATFQAGQSSICQVALSVLDNASQWFDSIQFEKGIQATDFFEGYNPSVPSVTYLKSSPSWLNCDGEAGEPAECANYARVCRQTEVGCEQYTPTSGDPAITGVATIFDQCPAECAGYAAYKQESSNFTPAIFPNYLIPSQARSCDIANVGCSQFTNLATEGLEYYSYLRACQKPTGSPTATPAGTDGVYYTWEGAEKSGYQLRTWNLKVSNLAINSSTTGTCDLTAGSATRGKCLFDSSGDYDWASGKFPVGDALCSNNSDCKVDALAPNQTNAKIPPCTNVNILQDNPTCVDSVANQAICTSADVGVNPDCQAFYDKDGNIFYRLYSKTVVVTDQCNRYRITGSGVVLSTQDECEKYGADWINEKCQYNSEDMGSVGQLSCSKTRGSWDITKNECLYAGYPAESKSCPATENSCQLFIGNAGANVQNILGPETFESGLADWTGGNVSAEATSLGGHSLKIGTAAPVAKNLPDLAKNSDYILTFWAKGAVGAGGRTRATIQPALSDNNFIQNPKLLTTDWQLLNFGPLRLTQDLTNPLLKLIVKGGDVFVDNVILRQVQQQLPLIKNSIDIPRSCDTLPAVMGGGRLPQAMLGCSEYKDRAGNLKYLKSFSSFCRDASVGCQDLIDTQNSGEMESREWDTSNSGVCRGEAGKKCCLNPSTNIYGYVASSETCATGFVELCTIATNQTSCSYGTAFTGTPGDLSIDNLTVPADEHAYLVVDQKKQCKQADRGCQGLGYQVSPATSTAPAVWSTVYLKNDPDKYEQIMCRYEENGCSAWTSGTGTAYFKDPSAKLCEWKTDVSIGGTNYAGWFKKGASEPCYQNNLMRGTTYGIWRNLDPNYQGQVGICLNTSATCTEFIDPVDITVQYPKGRPYYYLDNNKIDHKSCQGQVSRREGCVLFNQTDNPSQIWSAQASYTASDSQGGIFVAPLTVDTKDTNTILKVRRDRDCAEWLTCDSSQWIWDASKAKYKSICNSISRCDVLPDAFDQSDILQCANIVSSNLNFAANKVLDAALYQKRDTTWKGLEFVGYSIPNNYPAEELIQVNIGNLTEKADWRLVKSLDKCTTAIGESCTINGNTGKCYSGECVIAPNGGEVKEQSPAPTCRAYPERDSPFPFTPKQLEDGLIPQPYEASKVCTQKSDESGTADPDGCECSYTKLTYGGSEALYGAFSGDLNLGLKGKDNNRERRPVGICQGSPGVDGWACVSNSGCQGEKDSEENLTQTGTCQKLKKKQQYLGLEGLCLDYDDSRILNNDSNQHPCVAWLPVDQLNGAPDIYNQYLTAGFQPTYPWYCVGTLTSRNINIYNNDAKDYFGPPEPTSSSNLCTTTYDHNCENNFRGAGGFCLYPDARVASAPDNTIGPIPSLNLVGCYEVAAGGSIYNNPKAIIRYPWLGPEFYRSMIEKINIDFSSADSSAYNCKKWSGEDDGDAYTVYTDTAILSLQYPSLEGVWSGENDEGKIKIKAIFDNLDRLTAFEISAEDSEQEGLFYILGISLKLQNICNSIALIDDSGNNKAWTNRVWNSSVYKLDGNNDWRDKECKPWGAVSSQNLPATPILIVSSEQSSQCSVNPIRGIIYTQDQLKQLFSAVKKGALLNQSFQYNRFTSSTGGGYTIPWNITEKGDINGDGDMRDAGDEQPLAPKVLSLASCGLDGKCEEGMEGMTVNDKTSGNVVGYNGNLKTALRFYAYADANQMPIKELAIDWGDNKTPIRQIDSYYKNHRGLKNNQDQCFADAPQALDFGHTLNACDNSYFRYDHNYSCVRNDIAGGWTNACPIAEFNRLYGGCCVFRPKVMVKDNWGWCNGSCGGASSPGGVGCYDDNNHEGANNECEIEKGAYTQFGGKVILAPKR